MKTSPCGGILGSCIGFVGRNTTAGMPPAFFAPPPHICPLQGRSAKFGRICSDARRLRRRQGVPLFQSQPTQCGANGRNWPAFSYITAPLSGGFAACIKRVALRGIEKRRQEPSRTAWESGVKPLRGLLKHVTQGK